MSQQVNLYHPIFRRQEKKFSARTMGQASAIVAGGVLLLVALNVWQAWNIRLEMTRVEARQASVLKRLEQTVREFPPRPGSAELAAQAAQLEAILNASQQAQEILKRDAFRETQGYSAYLAALARQSVPGVRLTEIEITGAGRQLRLRGRTSQESMVLRYLQRLSSEKILAGLEFPRFDLTRPESVDPNTGKTRPPADYLEFEVNTTPRPVPKP